MTSLYLHSERFDHSDLRLYPPGNMSHQEWLSYPILCIPATRYGELSEQQQQEDISIPQHCSVH